MFFSSERGWLGSSDPFYFSKPLELSVILHLCNMNNMFFITNHHIIIVDIVDCED